MEPSDPRDACIANLRQQALTDHETIRLLQEQAIVDRKLINYLQSEGVLDQILIEQLKADSVADRAKIDNLETALVTARRIGAAIGIVMSSRKMTSEQAFDLLRTISQTRGRRLRDVAEEVLLTGSTDL